MITSYPRLPAAEMSAAIDKQDLAGDCGRVGQVHDRIRNILYRGGGPTGDRLSITSLRVSR